MNFRNYITVVALFLCFFNSLEVKAQSTYYVNDATPGSVFGTGAGGQGGQNGSLLLPYGSLGAAITAATNGDTIYVDEGLYNEVNLNINKSLTIIGAGSGLAVFTGNATVNRFATFSSNNITIKNISLANYYLNGNGQVITMNGVTGIVFENVVVKDNQGNATAGVNLLLQNSEVTFRACLFKCSGWNSNGGGTIWALNSTVLVENCVFKNVFNFTTSGRGGAIEVTGASSNVTVNETVFDDCTARQGGAIFQNNGTLTVSNSCFTNNYTQGDGSNPDNGGGAYCAEDANSATVAIFTNCIFEDNFINPLFAQFSANASCDGGCIQLEDSEGSYTFDKCSFDNLHANPARYDKGQDFHLEHVGTISVSITNSSFTASQQGNGSDQVNIYNKDLAAGELTITNCGALGSAGSYTLTGAATQNLGAQTWDPTYSAPNTNCIDLSNIADCGAALDCLTETFAPIIISCVPDQTITDCSALLDYRLLVSAFDDCSYVVTQSPVAGTLLPNGVHPVTMTVTDGAGNFTTCVFNVTVSGCLPCTNPTPLGDAIQEFCALDNPTIADLVATATTLVWYDAATNGNAYTVLTTPLVNGQTYYASDDAAGCDPSNPRLVVTVTIYNPTPPTITDTIQEFCALDNPTVADLLPSAYWYLSNGAGAAIGSILSGTVALVNGGTYVAVDSLGICESAVSAEVTVTIYNPITPTITDTIQEFCILDNPTVADLLPSAYWYLSNGAGAAIGSILSGTVALVNGGTYVAVDSLGICESAVSAEVTVTIYNPITPTITDTIQEFCILDNPTVADLLPSAYWYLSNGSGAATGSILAGTVALVNGGTYVAVDSLGICESAVSAEVTVTIYNPITPTITDTIQEFCALDNPTVADLLPSAYWYLSNGSGAATGSILAGTVALVNGGTYVAVDSLGICESAVSAEVTVTIYNPTPPTITDTIQEFCALDNPTVADLLPSAYWYLSNGAGAATGSILAGTVALVNGGTYVAVDSLGICESAVSAEVTVTIYNPITPTITDTIQEFCILDNPTVADLLPSAYWYLSNGSGAATGSILAGTVALVNGGTYVAVDSLGFCESAVSAEVTVSILDTVPPTTTNVNQVFCASDNPTVADLVASGNNVAWYATLTSTSPLAGGTPLVDGEDYFATQQNAAGCESSLRLIINVVVSPLITADAGNATYTICALDSVQIGGSPSGSGGSGTLSYSWSPVTGLSNPADPNPFAFPNDTTTYVLTVTDQNNCSVTDTVIVNSNELPVIDATLMVIDSTNCGNTNGSITGVTVTGFPVLTYSWSDGTSVVSNTLNLTSQPSGTYTLTVTDGNNCINTFGPVGINDIGGPVLDTSGLTLIPDTCGKLVGSISGITVVGGVGALIYTWQDSNGDTISFLPDLTGVGADTYVLTVYDTAGCQSISGPYVLNEIQGPSIDQTLADIMDDHCTQIIGAITGITASGGTGALSYSWSDGTSQVGTNLDLLNLGAGNYTLTVTDAAGCQATGLTANVLDINGPTLDTSLLVITPSACAVNTGSFANVTATGGVSPYAWQWFSGATLIDSTQNVSGLGAGNYSVVVTDSLGCTDSLGVLTIVNNAAPVIDVTGIVTVDASCGLSNGSISGVTVTGGTLPYSYVWYNGNGDTLTTLNVSLLAAGSYTLVVTDTNGCQDQVGPFVISNGNPPVIDLTGMVQVDPSCNLPNGSITGVVVSGGTGSITTVWTYNGSFLSNNLNINSLDTGWYIITVTDSLGCIATDSVNLVNQSLVTVDANDDIVSTLENTPVLILPLLNDLGGIAVTILNGPSNGTASGSVLYTPDNSFFGMDTIQYEICDTVCLAICDTAFIYIEVTKDRPVRIFDGFSPNGDGINETFHIENIDLYPNNELIIYSRWGDQVYYAQPYNNEWDGTSQTSGVKLVGNKVVDGTYYFVLKLTEDAEPINGFIDLRR